MLANDPDATSAETIKGFSKEGLADRPESAGLTTYNNMDLMKLAFVFSAPRCIVRP